MAKRSNVATIIVDKKKYSIESDAIVDIKTKTGVEHKGVRVVGVTMMNDGLRVVGKDGINEIPTKIIDTIEDSEGVEFSGVEVTNK